MKVPPTGNESICLKLSHRLVNLMEMECDEDL